MSTDEGELLRIKNRDKPSLMAVSSFKKLQNLTRVPKTHKKFIRRAKKTTFIYKNGLAIRVIKDCLHSDFLDGFDYLYSTSANESGEKYNEEFARNAADVIIQTKDGFSENEPSKIFDVKKKFLKRVR